MMISKLVLVSLVTLASGMDELTDSGEELLNAEPRAGPGRSQRAKRRKALIVSLKYDEKTGNYLSASVDDWNAADRFLTNKLGFDTWSDITPFTDGDKRPINNRRLDAKFTSFFQDSLPGDVLVVYFTGHGARNLFEGGKVYNTREGSNAGEYNGKGSEREGLRYTQKQLGLQTPRGDNGEYCYMEGIATYDKSPYYGLREAMMKSAEGVKIIGIFDCCHSAKLFGNKFSLTSDKGVLSRRWQESPSPRRKRDDTRTVIGISACQASEVAWSGTVIIDYLQGLKVKEGNCLESLATVAAQCYEGSLRMSRIANTPAIARGTEVRVEGLKSAVKYNGKTGRVMGKSSPGEWSVQLDSTPDRVGKLLRIKEENLVPVNKGQNLTITCSNDTVDLSTVTFYDLFSIDKLMPVYKPRATRSTGKKGPSPTQRHRKSADRSLRFIPSIDV